MNILYFRAKFVTALLILLILSSCTTASHTFKRGFNNSPSIKVAIIKGSKEVRVHGEGISVKAEGHRTSVRLSELRIFLDSSRHFLINGRKYDSPKLIISGKSLKVNGRSYRGVITLITEGPYLTVINTLPLELYLAGLINHEISSKWPGEAVKAQAVAARSYALRKMKSSRNLPYHLESTVIDQVYGGSSLEDKEAFRAVKATEGEVIVYNGDVAKALFHSSCGGRTEATENVWGGPPVPYLKSVIDPYCTDAPHHFWSYETNHEELMSLLLDRGYDIHINSSIDIIDRFESGRVKEVGLGGLYIEGDKLREIIGYDILRSAMFNLEEEGGNIIFTGSGSGHGVGMCQWGVKGMAEEGRTYKEILKYYYQGVKIERAY